MAFNKQEQELIKWGAVNGKSKKEVTEALFSLRTGIKPKVKKVEPEKDNYIDRLRGSFQGRKEEIEEIRSSDASKAEKILQEIGQVAGGATDLVTEAPVIHQGLEVIGKGASALAKTEVGQAALEKISPITDKAVETWNSLPENVQKDLEAVLNISALVPVGGALGLGAKGTKEGLAVAKTVTKAGVAEAKAATKAVIKKSKTGLKDMATSSKVTPVIKNVANSEVTKAFGFTAGDIKKIRQSTGNEVAPFLFKNKLIEKTTVDTMNSLNRFYKRAYIRVRTQIKGVQKEYIPNEVPRYNQALETIKQKVKTTPGLESVAKEVETLLNKKTIELMDVQKVKELLDDHFSLYKVTGDIKEGVTKKGLTNVRRDLKEFIEKEVSESGGDIKILNNDVSTAKSTLHAMDDRLTRGATASYINLRDLGWVGGGFVVGGPVGGAAGVALKLIYNNPNVKLKFAKFLNGLTDIKKLDLKELILKGELPVELERFIASFSAEELAAMKK